MKFKKILNAMSINRSSAQSEDKKRLDKKGLQYQPFQEEENNLTQRQAKRREHAGARGTLGASNSGRGDLKAGDLSEAQARLDESGVAQDTFEPQPLRSLSSSQKILRQEESINLSQISPSFLRRHYDERSSIDTNRTGVRSVQPYGVGQSQSSSVLPKPRPKEMIKLGIVSNDLKRLWIDDQENQATFTWIDGEGTAQIWRLVTGDGTYTKGLTTPSSLFFDLSFTENMVYAASCDVDGVARFWSLNDQDPEGSPRWWPLPVHTTPETEEPIKVRAVAINKTGHKIATFNSDLSLRGYKRESRQLEWTDHWFFPPHQMEGVVPPPLMGDNCQLELVWLKDDTMVACHIATGGNFSADNISQAAQDRSQWHLAVWHMEQPDHQASAYPYYFTTATSSSEQTPFVAVPSRMLALSGWSPCRRVSLENTPDRSKGLQLWNKSQDLGSQPLLKDSLTNFPAKVAVFSPNGRYIWAECEGGEVAIWPSNSTSSQRMPHR